MEISLKKFVTSEQIHHENTKILFKIWNIEVIKLLCVLKQRNIDNVYRRIGIQKLIFKINLGHVIRAVFRIRLDPSDPPCFQPELKDILNFLKSKQILNNWTHNT